MNYVLERDGLAACPDDPARVGDAEDWTDAEERSYDREWDYRYATHEGRLLTETHAVLNGGRPWIDIEGKRYGAAELYEAMTECEDPDLLAPLLVGDKALGRKLIEKFCDLWAARAADREMQGWQP